MKIAIPANAPDLGARVENRLGTAPYLLVIDLEDLSFEAVAGPPATAGPGAGIEAISMVTGMGASVLLAGFISPHIALALEKQGIAVITPVGGRVCEAVEKYRQGALSRFSGRPRQSGENGSSTAGPTVRAAFRKAAIQFSRMLPIIVGTVMLVGLIRGFVDRDLLLIIFSGNVFQDGFWGACIGSLLAGNAINSYVVGATLLTMGVSLFGVAALMLAWVNVGLLQLPVEISALGLRFAITRTIAAFLMAMVVSIVTVMLTEGLA